MSQTLVNALWITLIGMGLVFVSLFVLWGLMELMVKLTAKTVKEEAPAEEPPPPAPCGDDLTLVKTKAAAAAVSIALVLAAREIIPRQPARLTMAPSTAAEGAASAWQAGNRACQISQNAAIINRKPRGNE